MSPARLVAITPPWSRRRPRPCSCCRDGRFTLGLGTGENLNEHIVGGRWPAAGVRHQILEEAVEIIRALWTGDTVTYRGKHASE
jgi:alkanesulfonate monooxygenase SsuD/methylene tetrahydromethanopterin reductase-like flavin-dependent oxidoreductase (luciferase family)